MRACRATSIAAEYQNIRRPGRSADDGRCRAGLQRRAEIAGRGRMGVGHDVEASKRRGRSWIATRFPAFGRVTIGGVALPAGHSSIWFRQSAGFSPHDRTEAFANFFFGGFGNNYVDHGDEKRYREFESFPGPTSTRDRRAELRQVDGRAQPAAAALCQPRDAGDSRSLDAAGALRDRDGHQCRRAVGAAGVRQRRAQIDFRLSFLSVLELTMSVGGAIACEPGRPVRRELMFSAKIL